MGSKVFSIAGKVLSTLNRWYEASSVAKLFNTIWSVLGNAFCGSFIHRFFSENKRKDIWDNSIFGKIVNLPQKIVIFLQKKLSGKINHLVENSAIFYGVSNWANVSVRLYGTVMLTFGVILGKLKYNQMIAIAVSAVSIFFGLVLVLINRTVNELTEGSWIVRTIGEIFVGFAKKDNESLKITKNQLVMSGVFGVFLAIVCYITGIKYFALVITGIIGLIFLVKYLPLGVFITVALSPILPTMVLAALSILCAVILLLHVVKNPDFKFARSPMNPVVVFFTVALLWGCINSFDVLSSVRQVMVHISFIVFYFVVINTIRTKRAWCALIKLFLVAALVVAIYGVVQNFTGVSSTESWIDEEMFTDIKVRVYSFFNNPNVLGEFLVLTIPVMVALIWNKVREEHKTLFGIALLVMAACMVFTWSRGAWLGMLIAVAIFLAISDKRWIFVGVLAVVLVPVALYLSGNSAIVERVLSIGNTADTSTAYRVSIWRASIKLLGDFWLPGIGVGSDAYKTVYPVYALTGADFALHSHNLYLQFWVETGLIGIVSLLSLALAFLRNTFSAKVIENIKKSDVAKLTVALGAGFVGFMVQGLTDYVWYNYKILMIFWIIIALGISGSLIIKNDCGGELLDD